MGSGPFEQSSRAPGGGQQSLEVRPTKALLTGSLHSYYLGRGVLFGRNQIYRFALRVIVILITF